jgi:hypothetical protein
MHNIFILSIKVVLQTKATFRITYSEYKYENKKAAYLGGFDNYIS